MTLFDRHEAQRRKREGMDQAAQARLSLLRIAQDAAMMIAEWNGTVTSDDVAEFMERSGHSYDALGNAAGSVFRRSCFEPTGEMVPSIRPSTHGRLIRRWSLAVPTEEPPRRPAQ